MSSTPVTVSESPVFVPPTSVPISSSAPIVLRTRYHTSSTRQKADSHHDSVRLKSIAGASATPSRKKTCQKQFIAFITTLPVS